MLLLPLLLLLMMMMMSLPLPLMVLTMVLLPPPALLLLLLLLLLLFRRRRSRLRRLQQPHFVLPRLEMSDALVAQIDLVAQHLRGVVRARRLRARRSRVSLSPQPGK